MPKAMALTLLVCISNLLASAATAQTKRRQVSEFALDWDGHPNVRIALSIPSPRVDPGDFTRVSVLVPGHKDVVFTNETGWVKYATEATSEQVKKYKNLVPSEYVLALKANPSRTLLFLLGYGYASSPGSLDALEISREGDTRRVLHRDELGLKEFRDLNGDGLAEIVGYPYLSEEWGNGLLTYDPFNVYSLSSVPGGSASLSVPLSKNYNLRHYYGWAGPQCSEDIAVVLHPPKGGKPIVLKAKDAERLTDSASHR